MSLPFEKYQALGNDYLIFDPDEAPPLDPEFIRRVCDRHRGVGADGVLFWRSDGPREFSLRIFNPDGSEAQKSGNGLRNLARYLHDRGKVRSEPFFVATLGGIVECQVQERERLIRVSMGKADFRSTAIPMAGPPREVVRERLDLPGETLLITALSMGNPHCVLQVPETSPELALRLGPLIERARVFPERTNVQFVQVLNRGRIRIEIWERGAGYTHSSGTSSCAAAAASVRLGLCDRSLLVQMPGGELAIAVSDDFHLQMIGPAEKVMQGVVNYGQMPGRSA